MSHTILYTEKSTYFTNYAPQDLDAMKTQLELPGKNSVERFFSGHLLAATHCASLGLRLTWSNV